MKNQTLCCLLALAALLCGCAGKDPLEKKVDELYARMSLEEKATQLFGIYPGDLLVGGRVSFEKCRELIPYGVGHICQPTSSQTMTSEQTRQMIADLQYYLMNETPSRIPALFQEECLSGLTAGGATAYPQAIGVACSWNPDLVRAKSARTADEMREMGEQVSLSPVLDLLRSPHWARAEETLGEDGFLTAVLGDAFAEGLQAKGFRAGVYATAKHFLGYGIADSLSWKEIYEEVLLPYEPLIRKRGVLSVMTAFGKFHDQYAVCNDTLLNHVLRGYLDYKGSVMSDYSAVQQDNDPDDPVVMKRMAVESITAGNDMEVAWNYSYKHLPELVRSGIIREKDLKKSVKRMLMMKARAGLFDQDFYMFEEGELDLDSPENRRLAYEMATQSVVLLKNDGILPLAESASIALVGPNAHSIWSMLGDYTYPSMVLYFHGKSLDLSALKINTLLESLEEVCPGRVTFSRGCDWGELSEVTNTGGGSEPSRQSTMQWLNSQYKTDWDEAVSIAAKSDVIVAAMGECVFFSGEHRVRSSLRLPGDQEQFVKDLIATGKPVVLVVFGGRPQVIEAVAPDCAAVIQAWYPGEEGGPALASILAGRANPSGKLCISYPRTEAEGLRCYNELPPDDLVAYPFGYGLSYTEFSFSDMNLQPSAKTGDKSVMVSCSVTNTGSRSGDEVVQLYVSPASGQPLKPIQLKGFQRVSLEPGEKRTVTFEMPLDELAWWSEGSNGKPVWTISPGDYRFRVGSSSRDLPLEGGCTLDGKAVRKPVRDEYFPVTSVE